MYPAYVCIIEGPFGEDTMFCEDVENPHKTLDVAEKDVEAAKKAGATVRRIDKLLGNNQKEIVRSYQ